MNSTERFLIGRLAEPGWAKSSSGIANSLWGENGSWSNSTGKGLGLRIGAGMIPGIGAIMPAGDAIQDFRHGRWGSGLLNTGFAALGAVGGGAIGTAAKGLMGGSRIAKAAPSLARLAGAPGKMLGSTIGQTAPGRALTSANNWMGKNMGKTIVGTGLAGHAAGTIDNANAEASQANQQSTDTMKGVFDRIHSNPVFQDPVYAGHSENPNYADAPPMYAYGNQGTV